MPSTTWIPRATYLTSTGGSKSRAKRTPLAWGTTASAAATKTTVPTISAMAAPRRQVVPKPDRIKNGGGNVGRSFSAMFGPPPFERLSHVHTPRRARKQRSVRAEHFGQPCQEQHISLLIRRRPRFLQRARLDPPILQRGNGESRVTAHRVCREPVLCLDSPQKWWLTG